MPITNSNTPRVASHSSRCFGKTDLAHHGVFEASVSHGDLVVLLQGWEKAHVGPFLWCVYMCVRISVYASMHVCIRVSVSVLPLLICWRVERRVMMALSGGVYMCVYICVYVCAYVYVYVCLFECVYICVCVRMYVRLQLLLLYV